jgi:hypothetical protein
LLTRRSTPLVVREAPTQEASITNPLFGIDVSGWQQGLDIDVVAEPGYAFLIAKATEGPYRAGSIFTCLLVENLPDRQDDLLTRCSGEASDSPLTAR